ncbi:SDR family NAD(P)-dependent oxidoreductase [Glutamicibacter sp.]|uniref:SDR family NAD(P)-dependent oxidoreductase n=1 Tax=Glutamicibacter sp. TaxID=1931995 RepID=UPI003D6AC32E
MNVTFDFTGRTALITGAANGIGAATARLFDAAGAQLILVDRALQDLRNVGRELASDPLLLAVDLSVPGALQSRFGELDIKQGMDFVVSAAGIYPREPFAGHDAGVRDLVQRINVDAVVETISCALPVLSEQAAIVTLASIAGHRGSAFHSAYAASKGAILALTKSLAVELAPQVRVNAVSPGIIATSMVKDLIAERGSRLIAETPLGRHGTAEEIASSIAFLCSDAAAYITGQTLHVNGGQYIPG